MSHRLAGCSTTLPQQQEKHDRLLADGSRDTILLKQHIQNFDYNNDILTYRINVILVKPNTCRVIIATITPY